MTNLNPLQERLKTMMNWFHNYCERNHLTYYIVGGTMLGAMRHRGFIPWDDDIDVIMPRPDYEKLQALFRGIEDNYIIETPYGPASDFLYSYTKLYDTTTTMTEDAAFLVRRGVYIDIFPLDGLGNTYEESLKAFKSIDALNMFIATRTSRVRKGRKLYKNIAIVLSQIVPDSIVHNKSLLQKFDKKCKKISFDSSAFVANCASVYRKREIMSKSIYGKPTLYPFEDIMVYGVEQPDEYLSRIYGNWRELPPLEKRQSHHDLIELDFTKPYITKEQGRKII